MLVTCACVDATQARIAARKRQLNPQTVLRW